MGCIRLLLAIAVTLGHIPIYWQQPAYVGSLFAYYIVQIFFVISGFYISLVLNEKYNALPNGTRVFYFNRYMRLAPAYWLIATVTVGLTLIYPQVFPLGSIASGDFVLSHSWREWGEIALLFFTNIFMLAQDIPAFFTLFGNPGQDYLLIPQGWTLGAELLFYLLSPYLIKLRTNTLIGICVAILLLRFVFYSLELPFWPWQQRFFGCELMFFLFGILSYRLYTKFSIQDFKFSKAIGLGCGAVFAVLIMAGDFILPEFLELTAAKSLAIGLFSLATVPFIFSLTRYSKLDRWVGEFSYPLYLWHICVGYWLQGSVGKWDGWFLVAVSLLCALPVVLCLELPLERWRGGRVASTGVKSMILVNEVR